MSSVEIKNKFLDFFKNKDHMEIEDSSIIPKNDPTLLFINSGMAPIKNYFTGVFNRRADGAVEKTAGGCGAGNN